MYRTAVTACMALALSVGVNAWAAGDDSKSATGAKESKTAGQSAPQEVTAGKLAESPAHFYGTRVRVKAEVERVYNAHTFTLDEDAIGAGPDVLVLIPAPIRAATDDTDVTVEGMVRQFVRADLERDYDWFDFDAFTEPDTLVRIQARPVIVAESVRTEDGMELVSAPKAGATAGTKGAGTRGDSTEKKSDMPRESGEKSN